MELTNYQDYNEYRKEMTNVLNRTVEDFVYTGYLLKQGRDTDILRESGYKNVNEFAWKEYKLDATQVSRYIRINDKFSEGGYSPRLQAQYQGFGYAKLALMLTLPDEVVEELTPEFSKAEIQMVKEEVESEEKISDIEVLLEEKNGDQEEMGLLEKCFHQLFLENPDLYIETAEYLQKSGKARIKELFIPDSDKIYSIRIQGMGKVLIYMNDKKEDITIHAIRQQEKEQFAWKKVEDCVERLTSGEDPRKHWEETYQREFPEKKEKEEIAPVQRKKPKVEKSKKVPKKEETTKKVEKVPEEKPVEEIPGQTELTRDFPEYCPDITRKEYMNSLSTKEMALYIHEEYMQRRIRAEVLGFMEKIREWLEGKVNEKGEAIEK